MEDDLDPPRRLRPDRRRALGVVLEGFRSEPREVPVLAVDLAPENDTAAADFQVDLFRMGLAPVRSLEGEIYPALRSWSIRHGSDLAGRFRWVSLVYDGAPFAASTLSATEQWTELVDALGLVVLAVGDFGLAEVERLPDAMRQDAYADRLSVRTREGRALGATVRAGTW